MNFVDILCPSCALFFDFDGTLVDIAPQPDAVIVPPQLPSTLEALSHYLGGAVALITGRPIAQMDEFLAPLHLPTAGVHGAERRSADGVMSLLSTYSLAHVEAAVDALTARYPALRIERKRGSVAVHFRQAPELEDVCREAMQAAIAESPGLALMPGKMVFEAKPSAASKGHAIDAFMLEKPFAGRTPVFVGDDVTDEVGFCTVQSRGGLGVKVGAGTSAAWHRVESPTALLRDLIDALHARSTKATQAIA